MYNDLIESIRRRKMAKAILGYKECGNGYSVRTGSIVKNFETYSGAYKHTKVLLEANEIDSVENHVFAEHSIK